MSWDRPGFFPVVISRISGFDGRRLTRAAIVPLVAGVALVGLVAPLEAAPAAPHGLAVAASPMTLVRDYCGRGFHRVDKTRDKWGAWRGKCVPNKPKKTSPPPAGAAADAPRRRRRVRGRQETRGRASIAGLRRDRRSLIWLLLRIPGPGRRLDAISSE